MKTVKDWMDWLFSQERREGKRRTSLPLVAYYWDGAEPVPHAVLNASATGIYLLTQQRWYPGTVVTMTLQRAKAAPTDPDRSIAVNAKVVRSGKDGVGLAYVLGPSREPRRDDGMATVADMKSLSKFLDRLNSDMGQALMEFALILPLVFLLIVNAVNFGGLFFAWIGVADATRAATNYAILGGASAGGLTTPGSTAIKGLVTTYSPLPNASSLVINICRNANGTLTTVSGTCSTTTTPADPEGSNYTLTSVDVTYTYKPFIKLISLGNIHLTVANTTIHQFGLMRSIQ